LRPSLKKAHHKKELVGWLKWACLASMSPEVKPQYCQKKILVQKLPNKLLKISHRNDFCSLEKTLKKKVMVLVVL
jgi:hypothetical protein